MSSIVTETMVKPPVAVEVIPMILSVRPLPKAINLTTDLEDLLVEMNASSALDQNLKAEMLVWKEVFFKNFLHALNTDEEKSEASLRICDLIVNIIRPNVVIQKGNEKASKMLLRFEDRAKDLLKHVLPATEKLEAFIEEYEECSLEREIFLDQIAHLESIVQEIFEKMEKSALESQTKMDEKFQCIKKKMIEFQKHRTDMTEELNNRLNKLSERIDQIEKSRQRLNGVADIAFKKLHTQLIEGKTTFAAAQQLK